MTIEVSKMGANFEMHLILREHNGGATRDFFGVMILAWGTLRSDCTSKIFKKILTIYIHVIDRRFHHSFVNYIVFL